jgi:hypothetical protein
MHRGNQSNFVASNIKHRKRLKEEGRIMKERSSDAVFLSVFVLLTLQSGSIISASSDGQLRASVVGKTNILTEERNYGITRFNTRCS